MRIINYSNGFRISQKYLTVSSPVYRIIFTLFVLMLTCHTEAAATKQKTTAPLPTIRNTTQSYTFNEGELAVLYCSVDKLGPRTVVWRRTSDPNPLTIGELTYVADDRFQIHRVEEKGEWNLAIKHVRLTDAGMYECQISTKEKNIRNLLRVFVIEKTVSDPEIKIYGPSSVKRGDNLVLACNATGGKVAPHDLDWVKDDVKLVSEKGRRVHITKHISYVTMSIVANLTIENVTPNDGGTYLCRTPDNMTRNITVAIPNDKDKRMIPKSSSTTTSCASTLTTTVIFVIVFITYHCSSICADILSHLLALEYSGHSPTLSGD